MKLVINFLTAKNFFRMISKRNKFFGCFVCRLSSVKPGKIQVAVAFS